MTDSITIHSVENGTRLTFSNVTDHAFDVSLEGPAFSGHLTVSDYHIGISPNLLFTQLAVESFGWKDEKRWSSLEGEFCLSAKMDKLGHVFLLAAIGTHNGRSEWKLQAELTIESGQLDALASSLNRLFSEAGLQHKS